MTSKFSSFVARMFQAFMGWFITVAIPWVLNIGWNLLERLGNVLGFQYGALSALFAWGVLLSMAGILIGEQMLLAFGILLIIGFVLYGIVLMSRKIKFPNE